MFGRFIYLNLNFFGCCYIVCNAFSAKEKWFSSVLIGKKYFVKCLMKIEKRIHLKKQKKILLAF